MASVGNEHGGNSKVIRKAIDVSRRSERQIVSDNNRLYFGDNLKILRDRGEDQIEESSIDLIYLDPPFNSDRKYNVLYKDETGKYRESQMTAFDDTWHWDEGAARAYLELLEGPSADVSSVIGALHGSIGNNQMMAYLVMMGVRLVELQRVLKPTGSIYLHSNSVASHYLKLVMDAIFHARNFRNEIIWHYGGRGAKAHSGQFPRNHDVILVYGGSGGKQLHNPQYIKRLFTPAEARKRSMSQNPDGSWFKTSPRGDYTDESIARLEKEGRVHRTSKGGIRIKYPLETENGLVRDDELVGDVWNDIPDAMHIGNEYLGYPTQKPLNLLERIILSSSERDQIVLDPFCGCGTTIAAAQRLGRRWIGIDITHLSIGLLRYRLEGMFPGITYDVRCVPNDIAGARQLASDSTYQFQWWIVWALGGQPLGGTLGSKQRKKGRVVRQV
jgi:site-specific DNA-methyltransferase (adenine-specific)